LVPILTETLAKQGDSDDDDDWNPAKAAGVCIMLLAQCTGDSIVDHICPFIDKNLQNPNWRYREASIMAFGSILDGPNVVMLTRLVESGLFQIIASLSDPQMMA
uniref:Importin subunit beta-1 n=1 Tax=Gongylonema pulchrum TaxID=637853 RepID=A0A183EXA5_9BILA